MRKITELIIHCSATLEGRDYSVDDIDHWHRQRGWDGIGYHYVVYRDGTIHTGRPMEQQGAHCYGHNATSIGICYIGGLSTDGRPKDTRTPQQRQALRQLIAQLQVRFPGVKVHGHSHYAAKACPCFQVPEQL